MWLKSLKIGLASISLFAGLSLVSTGASAVSVTFTEGTPDTSDDSINGETGQFDGTGNAVEQFIVTNGSNGVVISVAAATEPGPGDVTGFELVEGYGGAENSLGQATLDGGRYILSYVFTDEEDLALKITGNPTGVYVVNLSAVPLPAAAWMFLSMLFGGAWIKRRGARSKGGIVATA